MSEANNILLIARSRGEQLGLPYAGALEPAEAHTLLLAHPEVKLIDVRSAAEWALVGRIPGAIEIELKSFPGMVPNPHFADQLKQRVSPEHTVLFICRSGARSHDAAMLAHTLGYAAAYNVLQGFEGDKDANGHRGNVNGWKAHRLPWIQS
ncbi:rhodanese-like domain-containing protein [Leeia oryzae]|uniref:rhodanese-like domain-containing protein n=1 Tax=Leeia oryzae TaxID=356662 RepID=UPI0003752166|nr:rhodanese-like domain-containing protein [Leeia oryzae]